MSEWHPKILGCEVDDLSSFTLILIQHRVWKCEWSGTPASEFEYLWSYISFSIHWNDISQELIFQWYMLCGSILDHVVIVSDDIVRGRRRSVTIEPCIKHRSQQSEPVIDRSHDGIIKWKHFPRCWPFMRGIHRWQRPVTRSFDVFFDLRLNKRLSKQSWGCWFETPWSPLWLHCNEKILLYRTCQLSSTCPRVGRPSCYIAI